MLDYSVAESFYTYTRQISLCQNKCHNVTSWNFIPQYLASFTPPNSLLIFLILISVIQLLVNAFFIQVFLYLTDYTLLCGDNF